MIWFKSCPRCEGDIVANSDHFGAYKSCLSCGYVDDLEEDWLCQSKPNLSEQPYDRPVLLEPLVCTLEYL